MTREGYLWLALVALAWLGATDVRTAALGVSSSGMLFLLMDFIEDGPQSLMLAWIIVQALIAFAPFLIAAWSLLGGGA